jgi:ankyrin repeat protein
VSNNKVTVRLLLNHGADTNSQGGYHGSALQAAAAVPFSEEAVRLLLDHGADVNAQGGYHGSTLQAATAAAMEYGDEAVMRLLHDRGAKVFS